MRITFVLTGRSLSGGDRVIVSYGNRLIERGHEVTLVYFRSGRWPRRPKALAERIRHDVLLATGWRRDHIHDFTGRAVSVRQDDLARAVPDGDVVLATHWHTAEPVAALPPLKGRKFYFIQGYEAHSFDSVKVNATWRLPMRKIVISSWLQALACDRFGDRNAEFVPNGVDAIHSGAPPRDRHSPPIVGMVYHRARNKGCDVALDAIRLARQEIPDLQVIAFGSARPTTELPLPPGSKFYFRPPQSRIPEIYRQTDVWLLTSRSEGFGLPCLEAMANRCPVVATRCGGPEEIVKDEVSGYLVPVDNAPGLADRIVVTLSDCEAWRRMSEAAYRRSKRFDINESVTRFEAALTGQ